MLDSARALLLAGMVLPMAFGTTACGGGGVASTPAPLQAPAQTPPPPPPPPPPSSAFNTVEYQRSVSAFQAGAITAYAAGATGAGVIAGVIDSGIDLTSAEFTGRIHAGSGDFVGTRGLQDEGGHGTAVSSILLGAKNDLGTHGVAFNATLLVLRTDSMGSCANAGPDEGCTHGDNAIARGVDRAVASGARVINISLGGSPPNATLRTAIDRATAAGLVIVFSAGNEFDSDPIGAANPDSFAQVATESIARGQIIIAGAVDASHQIASFSNRAGNASSVYLTALGVRVRSIDETGTSFLFNGTSFSAPTIAGAVALLAQAFPNLTGRQIVDLLLRTATDLGAVGDDPIYGRGELNIERAFQPQGQTSLAGSVIAISTSANGSMSAPMGDAGKTGLGAIIVDGYGRAFNMDFSGTIRRAYRESKLVPGLALDARTQIASGRATGIALSIAPGRYGVAVNQLLLAGTEQNRARALAGSVVTKLSRDTQFALGFATPGATLIDVPSLRRASAFLIAEAADDGFGFAQRPQSALAVRHNRGRTGLSVSVEQGDARLWERDTLSFAHEGYRRHAYDLFTLGLDRSFGAVSAALRVTQLHEKDTILGSRLDLLSGGKGATSWFGDAQVGLIMGVGWRLGAATRFGWTRIAAGGLRARTDHLRTNAWSFDVSRTGMFGRSDQLSLRVSQPLRVAKGGFNLTLPISYDYISGEARSGTSLFNLTPDGRERIVEGAYRLPILGGTLTTNLYFRKDPGNIAATPDDIGAAVRFSLGY